MDMIEVLFSYSEYTISNTKKMGVMEVFLKCLQRGWCHGNFSEVFTKKINVMKIFPIVFKIIQREIAPGDGSASYEWLRCILKF